MQRILVTGASRTNWLRTGARTATTVWQRQRHCRGAPHALACRRPTGWPLHKPLTISDHEQIDRAIKAYEIDTIYHLSSILSALAEQRRQVAYRVNIQGLYNILEAAVDNGLERLIIPSSIAAFGPDTPGDRTHQRHHTEAQHALRHRQGIRGTHGATILRPSTRMRRQRSQAARHHQLEDRTNGWNDRLCRGDFLWRHTSAPLYLLPETRHLSGR